MRIAHLIDSLTIGGAERLQVTFAQAAREFEVDITVIALYSKPYREIAEQLERAGARVVMLPGKGLLDPLRFLRLVRLLRRESFEVLFTHLTAANILGPASASLAGTPCISSLHNVKPTAVRLRAALERMALRRLSARILAVGQVVAEAQHERLAPRNCLVVPNPVAPVPGVESGDRQAVRAEISGGDHDWILMSTGMLTQQKAFGDLLTAFAELRRTHPGVALVIAGGGPLEGELEERIEALGLQGHARLLGVRHDVPRLLASVDAYVCSSHWEGLPISVLEAMAAGLPVISTAVGDLPSLMVEGTGLLVEPKQPTELASALRSVLEDSEYAGSMGEAARRHVSTHYSPRAWAERLLEIAEECARRQRSRRRGS